MARNTNTKAVSDSDTAKAPAEGTNTAENTTEEIKKNSTVATEGGTATESTDEKSALAAGKSAEQKEGADNAAATAPPPEPRFPGVTSFVYAGPSLPGGRLKRHTVLSGTYAEIAGYYKDAIGEYPNVARLIVPASRFAETRDKTQTSGNILYKWYQEIEAAIKAKGAEK